MGAAVVGDMASRPNWGLNELDFVFSTLVVGSILNFTLMYMLAPVAGPAKAAKGLGTCRRMEFSKASRAILQSCSHSDVYEHACTQFCVCRLLKAFLDSYLPCPGNLIVTFHARAT